MEDGERRNHKPMAYPTVDRLSDALAEDHSAVEFEEALEELLNRIALIRSES
jgi:hypothetical protein